MSCPRATRFVLFVSACLALVARPVSALEIIQIRTGQSGGAPGSPCLIDDTFRYNPVSIPNCSLPFRGAPFTAADFAAAAGGPPAAIITKHANWLTSLPYDPLARWINATATDDPCYGVPMSVLYARPFIVTTAGSNCGLTATVDLCWAIDDALGDPAGPNAMGLYLNGTALDAGFTGGLNNQQTCHTQYNVPVVTGQNWLYVYQRDLGCAVSGLILSATITVNQPLCPHFVVFKFNDLNGDGVQQMNEPPLSGWTFNLFGPSGGSAISDANGIADFGCVLPGSYIVSEVAQPGWVVTSPATGQQNLQIECGQDYAVTFANHECGTQGACAFPPKCLSAQWLFSECGGSLANETMANRDGTLMGASPPTWTSGRLGAGCGLNFSNSLNGRVEVPDAPELNFDNKSFTISAWVRTTQQNSVVRTVIDKRVDQNGQVLGYVLYLYNGQMYFQYNDGPWMYTTHASTSPGVGDGAWHHLAVSVCRDPQNPASNVARLYVDNYVDTFTGASIPTGSLTNTANLRIGDQCPGFFVHPFAGDIDDVLLFKCCLTQSQIQAMGGNYEYCTDACYVPSILSTVNNAVVANLTLCNYATTPQTYSWTAAAATGAGCNRTGPPVFAPPAGTVTVPAATSGPACVTVPVTIQLPGGMNWLDTACYQISVLNQGTGRCCTTRGRVRRTVPIDPAVDPTQLALAEGTGAPVQFTIANDGPAPLSMNYRVSVLSSDGDQDQAVVRLNGLPPGEPVLGTLFVLPGTYGVIGVTALLEQFQPLNVNEVLLSADLDGDGLMEDLGSCAVWSAPGGAPTAAPEVDPAPSGGGPVARLVVAPNPFQAGTMLHLVLPSADRDVRIDVFNAGGRRVRALHTGAADAGDHAVAWDARDGAGRPVPNGLYFIRVRGRGLALEQKVLRIE